MVFAQANAHSTRIELSPNRSASWKEVKILICVISTVVLLIATAWSIAGAWLILPFAGFEVGLLALLMYRVSLYCHSKQVLTITPKSITFECGIKQPYFRWQFVRTATHVNVVEAETQFDRPKMVLTDDRISIPLGEFLNQQDCHLARTVFKQAGLMEISNKWWKQ
ncbi:DUF2244 domain-containing protein [Aliiglaciecola litoralis]|uniref:DUF2244 domain-containing protein n=1 Tax=Aliiglaciecola litoralis TaxID=582857 RepID=A0ABP3WZQ7_9ALTE